MFKWIRSINHTSSQAIWTRICEDIAILEKSPSPPLKKEIPNYCVHFVLNRDCAWPHVWPFSGFCEGNLYSEVCSARAADFGRVSQVHYRLIFGWLQSMFSFAWVSEWILLALNYVSDYRDFALKLLVKPDSKGKRFYRQENWKRDYEEHAR